MHEQTSPPDRLHALDAVRALALLLGVALHGAIPWVGIPSTVAAVEPVPALTGVFQVIHMFRMPVFFLIAGFFGRMLLERRGTRAFIRDRARRIVLPLVIGWPVVAVLVVAAIVLGTLASGTGLAELSQRAGAQQAQDGQGGARYVLMHLWFLYYLVYFYAAALLLRWLLSRNRDAGGQLHRRLDAAVAFLMRGPWGAILLAVPVAAVLVFKGWGGYPGPPPLLLPEWGALVIYGYVFGFGWLLHRQPGLLLGLSGQWLVYLVLAIAMTVASLHLTATHPRAEPFTDGNELLLNAGRFTGRTLLVHSAAYAFGTWCWMFAVVAIAVRFLSGVNPVRRYLADASYWIYLLHVPLLFFFEAWLLPLGWHWSIAYVATMAAAMVVLLLSYQYLVRDTFIGATLNGKRQSRRPAAVPAAAG